ncbi:hypothetical protein QO034_03735 [Sedimentitalea sp. JM2-8]|uniref:Uncharacterized protein n=1 Tax=Sedimentitalea xiamensis TaxID=3050037 RepID=A0ABT7FAS6_9RHOB|nr:hypothetical protein [Sedimentitalea xiamensis]MDK3072211.1 hypothetical protein [Sedimentitalea xiamensis]
MPIDDIQRNFLKTFITDREFIQARIDERKTERKDVAARKGDDSGQAHLKKASDDHSGLEAMLKRTGRADDPTSAKSTAQRKTEHLTDIFLRDEDGLNGKKILNTIAPVTREQIALAKLDIEAAMPDPRKAEIRAAKDAVARAKFAAGYVQERLMSFRGSNQAGGQDYRSAKNAALERLSAEAGEQHLSHYASRHGPQTALDEHAARIATGFAPDDPRPAGVGQQTVQTRNWVGDDGTVHGPETVTVPDVRELGPHAVGNASRTGTPEAGLYMVEDALSDAHAARSDGSARDGDKFVKTTKNAPDGAIVGDAVALKKVGDEYQDEHGVRLPGAKGLQTAEQLTPEKIASAEKRKRNAAKQAMGNAAWNALNPAQQLATGTLDATELAAAVLAAQNAEKSDADKAEIIEKRAKAVMIDREVRSSKVILVAEPDGGFRTITAFPDASVEVSKFENETGAQRHAAPSNEVQAIRQAAREAATTAERATKARDDKAAEVQDSLADSFDAITARPALQTEYKSFFHGAESHAQAVADKAKSADVLAKATQLETKLAADLASMQADLATARTAATQATAARGPKTGANWKNQDLRIAEGQAKQRVADAETAVTALQARLDAATQRKADVKKIDDENVTALAGAVADRDKRRQAAIANGGDDGELDRIAAAAAALTTRQADLEKLNTEQAAATAASKLATDLSIQKNDEMHAGASAPTDANVASERAERADSLRAALAQGPAELEKVKKAWIAEIETVALMFADDADRRKANLDELKDDIDTASEQLDLRKAALEDAERRRDAEEPGTPERVKAEEDVAAAEAAARQAETRHKLLRGRERDAQSRDAWQERQDGQSIALAKARVETTAAETLAEDAEASGAAPEAVAAAKALAARRRAEEAVAEKRQAMTVAIGEHRDLRKSRRMMELEKARLDQRVQDAKDRIAGAAPPLSPEIEKLRDETLPQLEARCTRVANMASGAIRAEREAKTIERKAVEALMGAKAALAELDDPGH